MIPRPWARACATAVTSWLLGLVAPSLAIEANLDLSEMVRGHWQTENGLHQDAVTALLQTRDGFLWIGTRSGLVRFDGVQFTVFDRHELPLERTTHIQALAEDHQGRLWIGTDGGELLRYQAGDFRLFSKGQGLAVGRITNLLVGPDDELWIGTYGDGLHRFADGRFEKIPHLRNPLVSRLALDANGVLWIGSYGGGVFSLYQGRFSEIGLAEGLPDLRVWSVEPSKSGGVWVGSDVGLCLWRAGVCQNWGTAQGLRQRQVISLHEDQAGVLWIGTYGGGLHRLHPRGRMESLRDEEHGANDIVWSIAEDREGMIWLGTTNHGLRLFADSAFNYWRDFPAVGEARMATALAEGEDGEFFIGTRDHGLYRHHQGQTERLGAERGLDTVWSLRWHHGVLWIGSNMGLWRWHRGELSVVPLEGFEAPPTVSALEVEGEVVWVGTTRGLLRLAAPGRRFFRQEDGLPSSSIRDLLLDRQGRLWIATLGGLAVLDSDEIRSYGVREGLPGSNVVALHEDRDGSVWLAVAAGGLARLEGSKIEALSSRDGLGEDDLTSLVEDSQGYLWLGSSRGLARISRVALLEKLGQPQVKLAQALFDRFDGLDAGGVWATGQSALAGRDGRLYFATLSGVAIYDPSQAANRVATPPAIIDRLWVDDRPIPLDRVASLPATSRKFSFRFAAPIPHAGAKVQMRHRLVEVGSDEEQAKWVDSGRDREVTFAGLAPGHYRFEVQASNTAGIFHGNPSAFELVVQPGLLESPNFLATLTLLFALCGWALHRVRLWQLERRERELATRIEAALADIRTLNGLLPICGTCHKVRDDDGYWQQVESYLSTVTEAQFTHGLCPDCAARVLAELDDSKSSGTLLRRESA